MVSTKGSCSLNLWSRFRILLATFGFCATGAAQELASDGNADLAGPALVAQVTATSETENVEQDGLRIVWRQRIGSGYSGVATDAGIAVTMYSDGEFDVMAAFDREQGRRLWTHRIAETYRGHNGSHDGPISTPAVVGGRVFGLGPRGELFARDVASGEEIWSTHLTKDHGIPPPLYGFGTSPILEAGVLIVPLGGEGTAVGGFDPATGEKKWTSGTDFIMYQSPVPVTFDGRRQVVTAGGQMLFGLEPKSGEILWQWPHEGSGGRGAFSLIPLPIGSRRFFLAHSEESSKTIELNSDGNEFAVEEVWDSRSIRNSYGNPVFFEGHLYGFTSRILACADAATGELKWRSRPPGDGFLTLADGGRIVIFTKKGSAHLVAANPESYREVAALPVFNDLVWTLPSLQGGSVYVRSLGEIARVDLSSGPAQIEAEGSAGRVRTTPRIVAGADSAFGRFLVEVAAAGSEDKAAIVERFLASQKSFPIVEGDRRVHFVYRGEAADVALYGDMFSMRWEEPMERLPGTDLFHYSVEVESDARLTYVFIKDFEATADPRNPRRTSRFFLDRNREMAVDGGLPMSWFAMPGWRSPAHLEPAPAAAPGSLVDHAVESAVLGREITLEVYLPRAYESEENRRYPVAYVYGGSRVRQQSGLTHTLDHLTGETVEPVIVVFVDLDLPPFGALAQLARYEKTVTEEVVPFVDRRFRTIAAADARAGVAAWFSGHLALSAALRRPDVFGMFATQSIFLTEESLRFFEAVLEDAGPALPRGYMDWGRYDLRSHDEPVDLSDSNPRLAEMLRRRGVDLAGGEVHDGTGWLSWASRNDRILEALFPLR